MRPLKLVSFANGVEPPTPTGRVEPRRLRGLHVYKRAIPGYGRNDNSQTTVSDRHQKYTYLFQFHAKRARVRVAVRFGIPVIL